MKKFLIVVAHPDDEVLGMGASIYRIVQEGNEVAICTIVSEAGQRWNCGDDLKEQIDASMDVLGPVKRFDYCYPDAELNVVPHIEVVKSIEKVLVKFEPDIVITHFPGDNHTDHKVVSQCCQEAIRLFQRRDGIKPIEELDYMEVPSSTDWGVDPTVRKFTPNLFYEVKKEGLEKKIEALSYYRGVVRPYPHPRSKEAIEALGVYRGAQCGYDHAEAFECVFRRT